MSSRTAAKRVVKNRASGGRMVLSDASAATLVELVEAGRFLRFGRFSGRRPGSLDALVRLGFAERDGDYGSATAAGRTWLSAQQESSVTA